MTPLLPTSQPSAPQAVPGAGPGRAAGDVQDDGFALALQHGQDAVRTGAGTSGGPAPSSDEPADTPDASDPGVHPGHAAPVPPPVAPWPPGGLAGLLLSIEPAPDGTGPLRADERPQPTPALWPAQPPLQPPAGGPGGLAPTPDAAVTSSLAGPATGLSLGGTQARQDSDAAAAAEWSEPAAPVSALATAAQPTRFGSPVLATPEPAQAPDVRSDDFGERFGAQLRWMADQKIGHARIMVSPRELGPIEVMLRLDGDRISADFISAHAETRQALEHGLPRLRDLLGEHGFQLAHADVGQHSPSPDGEPGSPAGQDDDPPAAGPDTGGEQQPAQRTIRGLLDTYA